MKSHEIENHELKIGLDAMTKGQIDDWRFWERCVCVSGSREENRECAHPKTEAHFRDPVGNPLLTKRTEKENTVQVR